MSALGLPAGYPFRPEYEVTPREAKAALASGTPPVVLDVRGPDEYAAARIEGSTLIPLHEIESRFDEVEELAGGDRSAPIVVHCHHGVRSMKAALLLRAHGFTGAKSMAGGIDLWSVDVDPSVPRYDTGSGRIVVRR